MSVFFALIPAATAYAAPSLDDVAAQVDRKATELDQVIERHHALAVTAEHTKADAAAVAAALPQLNDQVDRAQQVIGTLATHAYQGAALGQVNALLTAGSPSALVERLNTLEMVSRGQRHDLTALTAAQHELHVRQAALTALANQQAEQERQLADRTSSIKAQLASLKKQQDQIAAARARAGRPPSTSAGISVRVGVPSGLQSNAVVAYAYAQLGKSYVFGAAGPNTFDCSGLTMRAWAQVGVRLSHSASVQMNQETTRISRSQLRPGDLVFFYSGGHVGLYIGNNNVIHAPKPGDVVKITSIDAMNGYSASGRPG